MKKYLIYGCLLVLSVPQPAEAVLEFLLAKKYHDSRHAQACKLVPRYCDTIDVLWQRSPNDYIRQYAKADDQHHKQIYNTVKSDLNRIEAELNRTDENLQKRYDEIGAEIEKTGRSVKISKHDVRKHMVEHARWTAAMLSMGSSELYYHKRLETLKGEQKARYEEYIAKVHAYQKATLLKHFTAELAKIDIEIQETDRDLNSVRSILSNYDFAIALLKSERERRGRAVTQLRMSDAQVAAARIYLTKYFDALPATGPLMSERSTLLSAQVESARVFVARALQSAVPDQELAELISQVQQGRGQILPSMERLQRLLIEQQLHRDMVDTRKQVIEGIGKESGK